MDCKLNGLRRHYVLVLMLLEVQWRPVSPAPTHHPCDLSSVKPLTELLQQQAEVLQVAYKKFHKMNGSVPNDVLDPTISGNDICQKLQDIYTKNVLLNLHILKVQEYETNLWGSPESIKKPLSEVKGSLANHLCKIKAILNNATSLPSTLAPPQFSHGDDYTKKEYGLDVIGTLKVWLQKVHEVEEQ